MELPIFHHLKMHIQTLHDYVSSLLQQQPGAPRTAYETSRLSSPQFDSFLNTTLLDFQAQPPLCIAHFQRTSRLCDLLHSCISIHLQTSRFNPHTANLMCLGYRRSREGTCGTLRGALAIENHYPNALLNYLSGVHWERLLELVGDEVIVAIFLKAIVIVKVGTGWLQVAGIPITEMRKGSRSQRPSVKTGIPRHRIFYGEPNLNAQGKQMVGLPFNHLLNRFKMHKLDKLVEKIFFRGQKVSKSKRKSQLWLRVRAWCLQLTARHRKCPYRHLYDYHCPDTGHGRILCGLSYSDGPSEVTMMGPSSPQLISSIWDNAIPTRRIHGFAKSVMSRILGINSGRMLNALSKS